MTKNKKLISVGKIAAVEAGVAAVSAGAYYLFGPKGKQHQKLAKAKVVEMKVELEKTLKKAENLTKPYYQGIVDTMAKTYSKQHKEYSEEINVFAKKLKNEWKDMEHKTAPVLKKIKSTIKKTIKKTANKK